MRFQTKLLMAIGGLLFLSVATAGLAYWNVEQSRHLQERSRFAHQQLEEYLRLSSDTYALFKQLADALLIGDLDTPRGRASLKRQLQVDLGRIRASVLAEVEFVGTKEKGEKQIKLLRLNALDSQITEIVRAFSEIEFLGRQGKLEEARVKLANVLELSIDTRFQQAIRRAIIDETRAVSDTDERADRIQRQLVLATQVLVAIAIIFAAAFGGILLRQLRRPLSQLLAGTEALSKGNLSHRIATSGQDEFAQLGLSFNHMAEELDRKQNALERARSGLEDAVAKRTEELKKANEALAKVDKARREFFADISHELRTPLTVVRGEGQIALRGADKSSRDYKASLRRIVDQAKQMGYLVDDLLFLARGGTGEARLRSEPVSMKPLIETVCADASVIARNRGVSVKLDCSANGHVVLGDPAKLRQLFMILLDNAICYSKSNGEISVKMSADQDHVSVRVSDKGIGISKEDLNNVFERFNRGSNAVDHHIEGIGLGLPVAKTIVKAHRGEIDLESKVDHGTTVFVKLPVGDHLEIVT